jgi:hypothetical protein
MHVVCRLAGAVAPVVNADWFIAEQIKSRTLLSSNDNARLVAQQLGNTYFLVCLIGLAILNTTSELRVVNAYLWACWIADITHVGLTAYALGWDRSVAVGDWNAMTWGNVGFTVTHSTWAVLVGCEVSMLTWSQVFLFLMRTCYFLGLFRGGRQAITKAKKMS